MPCDPSNSVRVPFRIRPDPILVLPVDDTYLFFYLTGEWDVDDLAEFSFKLLRSDFYKFYSNNLGFVRHVVGMQMFNFQGKRQAMKDIACHYDLGLDLFRHFLDKNMNYTCGYWRNASNLDEAQVDKMDLIGRKLKLEKGEKIISIGVRL